MVVTGAPSARLASLLASVADRESEGHAVVYLGAASVRRALDAGADAAKLLAQLADILISVRSPTETLAAMRALAAEMGTTVVERARGRRVKAKPQRPPRASDAALKLAQRLLERSSSSNAPRGS